MIKTICRLAAVAALALVVAAPTFAAARGSADFTRLVVLGDSYGAGVESGSLNERHQPYSWGATLARQVGAPNFVQPLVSYPGIGAELQLNDIIAYPPVITPAAGQGQPLLLTYPAPYNNLSIPGARVADLTTLTGTEAVTNTQTAFAQFILRGQGTAVQQAIAQKPTFIAIWIGGNDLLGAVLAGTPAALTPTADFRTAFTKMLDQLIAGAPNAGIVVGNLPTAAQALPVLTTVAPYLINPFDRKPVIGPNGQKIYFIADLGGGQIGQLSDTSAVLLPCSAQLATGFGIPAALGADPRFANLPNLGKPLPDACVVTQTEAAAIAAR
ncbi:MAG TPA: SGNH/GDSL hydrolase family protein, partial [Thermoanaerobaculia bacterium]|nr:SGNH/GDSL hydrolase family protein [Thermoanaerobaculia bacterium]